MSEYTLKAQTREGSGRAANNKIKKMGLIPAVYYHHGEKSIPLAIHEKEVREFMRTPHAIVNIKVGNKTLMAVTKEVQFESGKKGPIHLSFQGVSMNETFHAKVGVHVHHTHECGWQLEGGVVQTITSELNIECLPKDMPQSIEIDVSNLKVGDSYTVSQLKLKGVKFLDEADHVIASIILPRQEAEPVEEENTAESTVTPISAAPGKEGAEAAPATEKPAAAKPAAKDDKRKAS